MADFLGIDLDTLDAAQTRAAVSDTLVEGTKPSRWWRRQGQTFRVEVMARVRNGLRRGMSNADIARDLQQNVYRKHRHQANALAATSVNAVSNRARQDTLLANQDVVKGVQQVSTLDGRTSDTCIAYSGMAWELPDYTPIDGARPFNGGPPRHFNCRSTLVPVLRSFEELGLPDVKLPATTRASLDGQVPGDITFGDWLKTKPRAFQDEVLGPSKAQLWREGRIELRELVDQRGNPLTVAELQKKAATARRPAFPDPGQVGFDKPSTWFNTFNDRDITADDVVARSTPEQKKAVSKFETLLARGKATDELHKVDGEWTPERRALHRRIMANIFSDAELKKAKPKAGEKPVVTFLGGRGGSGKTYLTEGRNAPADMSRSIVLNSDEIKDMIPEYKGWNAGHVHEESSELFKEALRIAQQRKVNVILDVTLGGKQSKTMDQLRDFLDAGFEAEGFYMHLPRQEAAFRAIGRATKADAPRYVPLNIILESTTNESNFEAIIPFLRRWGMWDNQVKRGDDPRFLGGDGLTD